MTTVDRAETALSRVRQAVDLLLTDVSRTGAPARQVQITPAQDSPEWGADATATSALLDYGGHAFVVEGSWPLPDLVHEIADRIQDDVIDDTGSAWPQDPDGQGPLAAVLGPDGTAMWRGGSGNLTAIGTLPAP